jgi:molecular chaperone DnaK
MGGVVEVRASHGNTRLGGDDFDQRLAEAIAARFAKEHGVDLREDRRAWARLLRAAEMAKIELSSHPFAWIKEEYVSEKEGVPLHLEYEVSRQDFIGAVGDLLDQTLDSVERVMEDSHVTPEEISQVLLVGGSTRIPAVWELVANYLDIEPHMSINPEEAVALGAGVQAAIIAGEPIDAILVDVTPHSLGIAVAEIRMGRLIPDRYSVLIRRNTTIPVTKEEVYSTVHPEQDTVEIKAYQGESPIASENTLLEKFLITDLEPEHPGDLARVTVRFDFDVNGILEVTAQDRRTGQQKQITVEASLARLSDDEIVDAQAWVAQAIEAVAPTVGAVSSTEAGVLVDRAVQLLASGDLMPEDRDALQGLLAQIQVVQAAGNPSRLQELLDALLDLLFDLEED